MHIVIHKEKSIGEVMTFFSYSGKWGNNSLVFNFAISDESGGWTKKLFIDEWGRKVFDLEIDDAILVIEELKDLFLCLYRDRDGCCYKVYQKSLDLISFCKKDKVGFNSITERWEYVNLHLRIKNNLNPQKILHLNLIPSSSWWKNVRSEISKNDWDQIRKQIYQKADYVCEICGVKSERLDCNELWEYKGDQQILVGLEAICRSCHLTQHMGYASTIGKQQEAFDHLLKVNSWSGEEGKKYVEGKFREWKEKSKQEWKLDLSYLEKWLGKDKKTKVKKKYQQIADEMIKQLGLKKQSKSNG